MKRLTYIVLIALTACSVKETIPVDQPEIRGIRAYIEGAEPETRATVTKLADYVGRNKFQGGDKAIFTNIRRTNYPIEEFTYPGEDMYEGVTFVAADGGGWVRGEGDGAPERVYWTDAVSPHTFEAFCIPQDPSFDWSETKEDDYSYYEGTLGNPLETGEIVFDTPESLEKEDLLICYDTQVKAQPGGSVALVKFSHALSSVRVVVNINGFSSSSTAVDNQTVVSNMRLLHQPTYYVWKKTTTKVQPVGAESASRKDVLLWIPNPAGVGDKQARTFTFYGITTPQPEDYLVTILGEDARFRNTELRFDVTYPDPLNPKLLKTSTYTASLQDVCFESGYNTTINITLNHRDEQMVVGVDFEDWEFVSTPDQSQLKKNSTFLYDTSRSSVTIATDTEATEDDATWLYFQEGHLQDIYGHDGSLEHPFQISTAGQFLSFAYEVKNGRSFEGQYVALDADLTFEVPWIGVGDASHPFEGTFLGGMRYLYDVKGSPLFGQLAAGSRLEALQVHTSGAVSGRGVLTDVNEGMICASSVLSNVELSGSNAGALVGTNAGVILASYHTGATSGSAPVGGLVGSNSGTLVGCYQAGKVTGENIVANSTGEVEACLYTADSMTRPAFTEELNSGIASWCASHAGYHVHTYVHQPAGYPRLSE